MKTNTKVRCFLCGKDEILELVTFEAWVCEKDKTRFDKFIKRLKTARTRYGSVKSWKNRHRLVS